MNKAELLLNQEIIDISPKKVSVQYMKDLVNALEDVYEQDHINEAIGLISQQDIDEKILNVILLDGGGPASIPHNTLHSILETRIKNIQEYNSHLGSNDGNYGSLLSYLIPGDNAITKQIYFHINQINSYIDELKKMEIFDATEIDFFHTQLSDLILKVSEDYNDIMFEAEEINVNPEDITANETLDSTIEEFKELEDVLIEKLTLD